MSMSEAFSVPFYTLIKPCYTKALEWSSMVPVLKLNHPLQRSWILTISHDLTIHHKLSSWGLVQGLQDKVRRLRALVSLLSQYTCFLLYLTNSVVCLCEWITHPARSEHWACSAVWRCLVKKESSPKMGALLGVYTDLPLPRDNQHSCEGSSKKLAKHVDQTFLSQLPSPGLFDHFIVSWGVRATNPICQIIDFQGNCNPCY